ncbi:hypothetical protein AS160_06435 [Marinitoga sp. 38H-ov]|nr:hypothetical protein AS160_06435 [Marinitoga sp. 38H-ov]
MLDIKKLKSLFEQGITPIVPYTRPMGKKGDIRKKEFKYNKEKNVYICLLNIQLQIEMDIKSNSM